MEILFIKQYLLKQNNPVYPARIRICNNTCFLNLLAKLYYYYEAFLASHTFAVRFFTGQSAGFKKLIYVVRFSGFANTTGIAFMMLVAQC